ncbi:hypothetical protein AMK59_7410 [Oryctes borbonicus]|uniref:Uncharacterized protein n=1 Tax=Oryctes borbonicus TaxID=1629725 RepID=A0A0T6B057_9SCAR|nr:hypothetical protein AMK59_7410 [Oryctes borbonicus]
MPGNVKSIFLYGPNLEYVLFKNAINSSEDGAKIWFISPDPFKKFPSDIAILDKEILKNITFLYLKDSTELLKHLNSIHTWYRIPEIIILNNFHVYRNNNATSSVHSAHLCASLLDACKACSKKLEKTATLLVAYNIDPPEGELIQNIVDLYFDSVHNTEELPSSYIIPGMEIT